MACRIGRAVQGLGDGILCVVCCGRQTRDACNLVGLGPTPGAGRSTALSGGTGVEMAATPVGRNCRWYCDPGPLDWWHEACGFQRCLRALSGCLPAMAGCHANTGDRRRYRSLGCNSWPRDRHLGNAKPAGREGGQSRLRCAAGDPAYGLSRASGDPVWLRPGAGHAGHAWLCHAAHGPLHHSRHSNGARRNS